MEGFRDDVVGFRVCGKPRVGVVPGAVCLNSSEFWFHLSLCGSFSVLSTLDESQAIPAHGDQYNSCHINVSNQIYPNQSLARSLEDKHENTTNPIQTNQVSL